MPNTDDHTPPDRRAALRMIASAVVPTWGRCVVAIVAISVLFGAFGEGELSGFALVPAIFLCMSPPVGRRRRRVFGAAVACLLVAVMATVAAWLSESTAAIAIGLAVVGFGSALLPRLGPLAASMQLPLIIAFAYSAGQPLGDAAAFGRGLAVLAALPVYVLVAAIVFPVEQRRPLLLGAAAALADLARGLVADGPDDRRGAATEAAVHFRGALSRLRDQAIPLGGTSGDQAGLTLVGAVQQAVVAVDLLAGEAQDPDDPVSADRPAAVPELAAAAGAIAGALAGKGVALPDGDRLQARYDRAEADGDRPLALLADALIDARDATALLHHDDAERVSGRAPALLPPPLVRLRLSLRPGDPIFRRAVRLALACGLAGLLAGLLDLGRAYWPVFAVIIIFNAPVAADWQRALWRIAGSVVGVLAAVPLVTVAVDHHALGLTVGLLAMLVGLLLMPINYGAAVGFISVTVGMLFATGGNQADFVHYRLEDQLVGAGVALVVGLALWHTRREQWWTAARETAKGLAQAAGDVSAVRHRERLIMDLVVLRTETTEGVALRGSKRAFAAAWTFTAAAEELVRTLTGPRAGRVADPKALTARLRAVADDCRRRVGPPPVDAPVPVPAVASVARGGVGAKAGAAGPAGGSAAVNGAGASGPLARDDAALAEAAAMARAVATLHASPAPG